MQLNMAQVVTAFADRHPGMCKERTSHVDTSGLGWMKTGKLFESRPMNTPWNNEMAVTFMSEDWRNPPASGAPAFCITDRLYLSSSRIGIAGDYDIKLLSSGPPTLSFRAFGGRGGNLGASPNNVLALLPAWLSSAGVGTTIVSQWLDWMGQDGMQQGANSVCHNIIDFIGERETGVGCRWIISTSSDMNFPNENGHNNGLPYEYWYYDLGPSEGVYDPEFGLIGYKQAYCNQGGSPNGQMAEEFYMRVVPGEYHRSIGNYLFV